jgi:hypothetical protein
MMHCFVYHPTQLKLLDAQGKHKGLVSYNKNHSTSILKKHACHEYQDLYKKWGLFLLKRVIETKVKNRGQIRGKLSPFSNHRLFWQPTTLTQIRSFTISLFGGPRSLCCKGLPAFIFC